MHGKDGDPFALVAAVRDDGDFLSTIILRLVERPIGVECFRAFDFPVDIRQRLTANVGACGAALELTTARCWKAFVREPMGQLQLTAFSFGARVNQILTVFAESSGRMS